VVGLLAVEMFVLADGRVLMNELAARPHNSGHVTLRACTRSQFEMHIAAICNLPLSPVELLRPGVMTNLLGDLWKQGQPPWEELFKDPHGTLHLYGKSPRPGRKMGHMIHTAPTIEEARAAANAVYARIASHQATRA
jgi:5-(carboxyamino)imidazole ribonucleotide synthase